MNSDLIEMSNLICVKTSLDHSSMFFSIASCTWYISSSTPSLPRVYFKEYYKKPWCRDVKKICTCGYPWI